MQVSDLPFRDDARALALLSAHARTATAFQTLTPGMRHWFTEDGQGMVAYVEVGNAWVTAGEPIASRPDTIPTAEQFVEHAIRQHKRVSFFATEGALAASPRFRRVLIGEQPVWNPLEWPQTVKDNRSLREQLRRARAKGVRVRALHASDVAEGTSTRASLDALMQRWLATRPMSSMHFLVQLEPFQHVEQRRLFVAERVMMKTENSTARPSAHSGTASIKTFVDTPLAPVDTSSSDMINVGASGESDYRPIALLSLAPVAARNGWFLEHLLRDPSAPNGTSEAVVDFAMRALAFEGVTWATLGLAPLSGPVSGWLRVARNGARPFYNFVGLSAFKRKLRPASWEPIYLAYPRERHSVWAMLDALRAFAGGSLLMFGARTVLRGPPPLLRALQWSLIPWTIALALWPREPWFPHSSYKWGWVLFDVALLAALYKLQQRWNDALARGIATLVTLDTVLTLSQTVLWNASRTRSLLEVLMVIAANAGPALSAAVLWGAVRRRAVLSL